MMPDTSPAARMRAMILRDKTGREMEPAPSNEWIPQMIGGGMESAGQAMEDVNSIPGMPMFQNAPRVMGSHLQDMGQMMQSGSLAEQAFAMLGALATPTEPLFQNFVGEPVRQGALGLGADQRTADIASAVGQMGAGFMLPSMLATGPSRGGKVANALDEAGMVNFHGTPHLLPPEPGFPNGRFRLDKIGTGEGNQMYGWGIYTADAPGVAGEYSDNLSRPELRFGGRKIDEIEGLSNDARKAAKDLEGQYGALTPEGRASFEREVNERSWVKKYQDELGEITGYETGNLYTLDLPDEDVARYLDWDAPLSEQPESVRKGIDRLLKSEGRGSGIDKLSGDPKGAELYSLIGYGDKKAASDRLASAGIPGLKYFDQGSRDAGKGTRNYVTWDQDVLDRAALLERNGEKLRASADDLPMDEASIAKIQKQADGWRKYFSNRSWPDEETARAAILRKIEKENDNAGSFFQPTDLRVVDRLKFVRHGNGVKLSQAGTSKRKRASLVNSPPEGADVPDVNWRASDLQDYGGEGEYYISVDDLPKEKLAGGKSGYSWEEFDHDLGGFPPATIKQNKNGSISIVDGNHRIARWREEGRDYIPVRVVKGAK